MRYVRGACVVAMAVAGVVGAARGAVEGPAYTAQFISTTTGGTLYLTGINNNGQVSGYTERYSSSQGWTYQVIRVVDGQAYPTVLGKGWGINDSNTLVGEGQVGAKYGAMYEPEWQGPKLVNDPYLYYGRGISNDGTVVGESYEGGWGTGVLTWKPGQAQATNFGRPQGSDQVTVVGVNTWGTVIGQASRDDRPGSSGWSRPYYITTVQHGTGDAWVPEFHTLPQYGSDPDDYTFANDLNENGLVVGRSGMVPVMWRTRPLQGPAQAPAGFEVKAVALGTLGSDFNAGEAKGVDNKNRVVGWSWSDEGQHGFLYLNGRMVDLNKMFSGQVDGQDITITEALGINDRGQIIAYGSVGGWGSAGQIPLLLNPNYGATQEVPLPPSEGGMVDGRLTGHFKGVASGQWFDPSPTGHVHVVMEGVSLFETIEELPEGFGEMTVSVDGNVLGVYHAGDMVDLGGVSAFDVTWTGLEGSEYADFPMKLAFDTATADFRIESWAVVPEPGVMGVIGLAVLVGGRRRK